MKYELMVRGQNRVRILGNHQLGNHQFTHHIDQVIQTRRVHFDRFTPGMRLQLLGNIVCDLVTGRQNRIQLDIFSETSGGLHDGLGGLTIRNGFLSFRVV